MFDSQLAGGSMCDLAEGLRAPVLVATINDRSLAHGRQI
jgi:hypothetical protein